MPKKKLLVLCHRIPFPPNKGDKIRAFHQLSFLSKSYEIHLGCFADDPNDLQYTGKITQFLDDVYVVPLNKFWGLVRAALNLFSSRPLTLGFYANKKMRTWVDNKVANTKFDATLIFSSAMLQYVEKHSSLHKVIDFVDVDSDKWRQYALNVGFFKKYFFNREYETLRAYETKQALCCEYSYFVSAQEASFFCRQMPENQHKKVGYLMNGVDTDYFSPLADDFKIGEENIDVIFTGTMSYFLNVNAVVWFCKCVWPLILSVKPDARFYIVGGEPSKQVLKLREISGVVVTGRVSDVRPYLAKALVAIAPMQMARGIQNKILEAMAMAKSVVCTSLAIEGIECDRQQVFVIDEAKAMANKITDLLNKPMVADANRQWAVDKLQWEQTLINLPKILTPARADI